MPRTLVGTTGMNYVQHHGVKKKKKKSFGFLWKNKNKPGSKALPAKMTMLGYPPVKAGLEPAWRASHSWRSWGGPWITGLIGHLCNVSFSSWSQLVHPRSRCHRDMFHREPRKYKLNVNASPLPTALPERGERKIFTYCSQ